MAVTSLVNKYNDSVVRSAVINFSTDAVAAAATAFTFGFVPDHIRFINLTDRTQYEWFRGMASGTTLKTVAAGTVTLDTGDTAIQLSLTDPGSGCVVTFSAAALVASKVFVVHAEGL